MPSINDGTTELTFIHLHQEEPKSAAKFLRDITPAGVNGHAYMEEGEKAEPYVMVSLLDFASASAARTHKETAAGMVGKLATVTDEHEEEYTNVRVLRVFPGPIKKIIHSAGGIAENATHILRIQWVLQNVGEAVTA